MAERLKEGRNRGKEDERGQIYSRFLYVAFKNSLVVGR